MRRKVIVFISILSIPAIFLAGMASSRVINLRDGAAPLDGYESAPNSNPDDLFWANEILNGKRELLLWFRHGEREKWTGTVTVFDYFDVNKPEQLFPSNWRPAVCLTQKGVAESQLVGATLRELKINVSRVITSPSCRAKETANEAFGGYDEAWLEILHATAVTSEQQKIFADRLRIKIQKTFQNSANKKGHLIVTGHGNTLPFYVKNLFYSSEVKNWNVSELGFVVIEKTNKGLVARHSFVEFYQFANAVLRYKQ
jgi:phosphohistidine phosphatase SixA